MRITGKDLREGRISLRVETADGLWHLQHILCQGDLVRSRTTRKVSIKRGGEIEEGDRKPMTLTIRLEKAGFDVTTGTLRLSGTVEEGPETVRKGSHHTLRVEPGTELSVIKARWTSQQLKRLSEAGARRPKILVLTLDRDEAQLAMLGESGIRMLASAACRDREDKESYFREILGLISGSEGYERLLIAGPGFEAENFFRFLGEKAPALAARAFVEKCSDTGITGMAEILRRSGERILRETRMAKESRLVEEVLSRIKAGGLVAYGRDETAGCVEAGAAERLLVSMEKAAEFEGLMERCESMGGEVSMITSDHPLGEQFLHLGGIAAFLRFRVNL